MSETDLHEALRGVAFTTPTPFTEDTTAVDHDALDENLAWLESAGARLYIACGNTGEYYSLTDEERIAVVRTHVDALSDDAIVVGGAGGSLAQVKSLIAEYEAIGADAAMVMYPSFTYSHRDGLLEYYRSIAEDTSLGIVLYKRGPGLPDPVMHELSTIDNVVAVKYAVNDIDSFASAVRESPGSVVWMNGIAERFAPSFHLEGARSFSTGVGNFTPKATLALYDALQSGDYAKAREIRDALSPIETLRVESGTDATQRAANNVPVVKYGQELVGITGGPCRTPLVDLTDEDTKRLEQYYHDIQEALQ